MASQNTFAVRGAKVEDCEGIMKLKRGLAEHENLEHLLTLTLEDLKRDGFGDNARISFLVAEETRGDTKGNLIGYCLYHFMYDSMVGPAIWMCDLFVESDFRCRGVGSTLMKHLAQIAVDNDYKAIQWLWNADDHSAESFYKNRGAKDFTEDIKNHFLSISDMELLLSKC